MKNYKLISIEGCKLLESEAAIQGCLMSTNDAPRRASVYRRALWRQHGRLQFFIPHHTTKHTLTSADYERRISTTGGYPWKY